MISRDLIEALHGKAFSKAAGLRLRFTQSPIFCRVGVCRIGNCEDTSFLRARASLVASLFFGSENNGWLQLGSVEKSLGVGT